MRSMRYSGCIVLTAALCSGCAAALREPPRLIELVGTTDSRPEDVDDLLVRADTAFAERTTESVRGAEALWLEAAAADAERVEGLLGAARARIWLAEHETKDTERLRAAEGAIDAAQWCERSAPSEPLCTYYLALALGLQARERRSTGLDAIPRIVERLEGLVESHPSLDHAGPHRVLALVLLRAPGWPTGPGDPDLALEHAERAVALDPAHPPNHLALGEARDDTGDAEGSRASYEEAARLSRELVVNGVHEAHRWLRDAETQLGSHTAP